MSILKKKRIYLDYSGATPVDRRVARHMFLNEKVFFANPSSIFKNGVNAKKIINNSRENIAKLINAHSDEIIFTGSGTESDALAILGTVRKWRFDHHGKVAHVVTTRIEHPAVLENCHILEKFGEAEITYLNVDRNGLINISELKNSLRSNTVVVSIMYANNEIGTIEPIMEVAKEIRFFRKNNSSQYPIFHTDACQAMSYLFTENIEKLGVDLMTFNSSKIYGPKGIGALYKKRGVEMFPLYGGGGQELGLRSGTENLSAITGFSLALSLASKFKDKEDKRLSKIRDYGIEKILSLSDKFGFKIIFNGSRENRLPNNINISIIGISSELLVVELDAMGIEVSEKSACHSNSSNGSYVIRAINENKDLGSLRISMGRFTNKNDIDYLVLCLTKIMKKYNNWK